MTPTNLGGTDAAPTFPSPATRASSYEKAPYRRSPSAALDRRSRARDHQPYSAGRPDHAEPGGRLRPARRPAAGRAVRSTPACAGSSTSPRRSRWDGLRIDAHRRDAGRLRPDLVFGVATPPTALPVRTQLAELLDAHHYTDGFALVPQGRSDEQHLGRGVARSVRADPDQAISFAVEAGGDLAADAGRGRSDAGPSAGAADQHVQPRRYANGNGWAATAPTCSPRCGPPRSAISSTR